MTQQNRKQIEDAIEALIGLLDTLDGDPDLEDAGDDEPSLGWCLGGAIGGAYDLEEDSNHV